MCCSYMMSVFFSRTILAALVGFLVYLISYLPYIIIVSLRSSLTFWQLSLAVSLLYIH